MQKLYFFILPNSPYCKRTQQNLIMILSHNRKYRKIPIEIIDILECPWFVEQFCIIDYPAFYIGKNKIHEGQMDKTEIIQMLEKLLCEL